MAATTYTLDSLANVLNVPSERLRAWVRAGLVRPVASNGDVVEFDFRQVSAARALCDLLASGVTLGRVRKSLDALRQWNEKTAQTQDARGDNFIDGASDSSTSAAQPIDQLAILERSGVLLVRLEQGDLSETNGQYHFDFDADSASANAQPMRIIPGPRSVEDWFAQGLKQEELEEYPEAAGSYRQALLDGGPNADICFALANVLRAMGERQQAVERYLQVVEIDRMHTDAWNNLGLCLEELGSVQEAAGAFRRAIQADPDNWRAHYNLADALDELGQTEEAITHYREYLRHDRDSEQAAYAMKRTQGLE